MEGGRISLGWRHWENQCVFLYEHHVRRDERREGVRGRRDGETNAESESRTD